MPSTPKDSSELLIKSEKTILCNASATRMLVSTHQHGSQGSADERPHAWQTADGGEPRPLIMIQAAGGPAPQLL